MGYKLGFISTEKIFDSLKMYTQDLGIETVGYIKPEDFMQSGNIDFDMAQQFANKVDAIVVAVKLNHDELLPFFVRQSKHILLLDGLGNALEYSAKLENLLHESGTTLQIDNLERTRPVYTSLRQFLKHPQYCRLEKWTTQSSISSAELIDEIDMAIGCFQSRIADVSCHSGSIFNDNIDLLNIKISFQNGANADILIHGASNESKSQGVFVAKNGYYQVDFNAQAIMESAHSITNQLPLIENQLSDTQIAHSYKKVLAFDPLKKAFQNFIENIDYGFTPMVGISDIKNIAIVLQKAQQIMHRNCVNWA